MSKVGGAGVRGPQPPVQQSTEQVGADQAGEIRKKDKPEDKAETKTQAQAPTHADEFEIARPNPFKTLGGMGKVSSSESEAQFKHELGKKMDDQAAAQVKQELGRGGEETKFKSGAQGGDYRQAKISSPPSQPQQAHESPSESRGATTEQRADVPQQRGTTAEQPANVQQTPGWHIEQSADVAQRRGDVAEQHADVKQPRAQTTEQRGEVQQERGTTTEQRGDVQQQRGTTAEQQGGVAERRGDVSEQQEAPRAETHATDSEASPVTQESPTEVRRSVQEQQELQLEMDNKLRKRPG